MLSIRRLELQDFKSFAGTQVVEFAPGVSVIVGRNGSGKSNLVDAIRWVFGDDDIESLRAQSPEELRYRGDAEGIRPESCSVTAFMGAPSGHEVQVSRVLDDDGERYLLANETVERTDYLRRLEELGIPAPLGTVVRQGDVGRVLWLHPRERTELFLEQSAGVPAGAEMPPASRSDLPSVPADGFEARRRERGRLVATLAASSAPTGGPPSRAFNAMIEALGLSVPSGRPAAVADQVKKTLTRLVAPAKHTGVGAGGDGGSAALEQTMRFQAVHQRIEEHFGTYLAMLVPDASGSLPLTAPSAPGELPGIGLAVTFPRRPAVHVDALSGGQLVVVGLCLALAAFRETSSPALVLDEVEPALDDTMIRRVSTLLHEISTERQVIAVSHQRLMRYTADMVYQLQRSSRGGSRLALRYVPREMRGPSSPAR